MFRSWLGLALALHIVLATSYAWCTPDFEGPDENAHYEYAWHLANAGKLPLTPALAQQRGLPQTEGVGLAHHAPLYYALLAGVLVATGRDDTTFGPLLNPDFGKPGAHGEHLKFRHGQGVHPVLWLLRLVSVLLGACSILLVHRLGRATCPDLPRVADLAALLVACLPMWSFLHGVLNNDVLAATASCGSVLALVRTAQAERTSLRHAFAVGGTLGIALLTKLTTLFLVPLAGVVFVLAARRDRRALGHGAIAAAVALALAGWVFVRNHDLCGDWLALHAHDALFPPLPPELRWPVLRDAFLPNIFSSLLGTFGWFSLKPHAALLWTARLVAGLALFGLVRAAFGRERGAWPRPTWLLGLVLLLVFAGTVKFNWTAPQPQGRLLFPAIGPAAVFVAAGLVRASTGLRQRRWLALLPPLVAFAVLLAWFRPAFAIANAPAPAWHRALVGDIVRTHTSPTIAWQEPEPSARGLVLHWRDPDAPAGTRYSLYAYDAHGRVWLATHEWTHGDLVVQGEQFAVPDAALAMLPRDTELQFVLRRLPIHAADDVATAPRSAALPLRIPR